ncbi:MAG: choice-of-anchor Q domain-containing protein [Bdellovibrio sp.]
MISNAWSVANYNSSLAPQGGNTVFFSQSRVIKSTIILFLLVTGLFGITIGSSAFAATTYFVSTSGSDSNPGTQSLPWKTIGKANAVMIAGDTALISAGSYGEQITTSQSGIAGSKITFKAQGLVTVTGGFTIRSSYITIDGFTLTSDMEVSGSNCEVLNNHFVNARIFMPQDNSNCLLKGNHIESSSNWGGDWVAFDLGGSNHIVEDNEIGPSHDTDAFRPFGVGHIIRRNYIHDITLSPGSSAHMDVFQVFADNGEIAHDIVIENNRIINSGQQICMTSADGLTGIHDFDVRNNLFVNVASQANVGIPNFRFYNNTVINSGTTNGFILYLYSGWYSDPSHARILNNIFIGNASPYAISAGTDVVTDYNFIATSTYGVFPGVSDPHSINGGDPKFVNAAAYDYRLQSTSPAIDQGTAIAGFNYDAIGVLRPSGAGYDMGAYEYSGTTSINLKLSAPTNLRVQM